MSDNRPSSDLLNAYVDGELSPSEAAHVARLIAMYPDVAREVEVLAKLRAVVRDGLVSGTPELDLAPTRRHATRYATRWVAIAASIALLVIGSVAAFQNNSSLQMEMSPAALALPLHREWSASLGSGSPIARLVSFDGFYVPDLSSTKLTLAHWSEQQLSDGTKVVLLGYLGTRGCRVSLVVGPRIGNTPEGFSAYVSDVTKAYAWRAGDRDYVIVAEGMDPDRLAVIAESIHAASIDHHRIDDEWKMALAESRERSAPCAV